MGKHNQKTCNCFAYRFPHRYHSGKCDAPYCISKHEKQEYQRKQELDAHTGRPVEWECICLQSAHPHCPQHGDNFHRNPYIPDWMVVNL